jgi:penicillin amidase
MPQTSGTLPLVGLQAPVAIEREPNGVVHIRAGTDLDLFFALGVAHAQDRLWQMELQRRIGAGRLAEILGPDAVDRDRYLRTWGFYRAAEVAFGYLSDEARALIHAYAQGINTYLATDPPLPPEFRLLGLEPDPWSAADVLVWGKLMAYNLADNRHSELRRYRLLARGLSPERIAELMPLYPGESAADDGPTSTAAPSAEEQAEDLLALDATTREHLPRASNNWVVDGTRTESGRPLLANDVHLGVQLPSTWHLVHLQSPSFDVIGASLPGLPLVAIGRNEHIAWGVTNLAADMEDLYLIEERGEAYVHRGDLVPFETREETIQVRDGEPVTVRVRETLYGPVISDVVESPDGAPALALRWVGHDPDDTTFDAFLGINRANDWGEFRVAAELLVAPGQNFVYADAEGHIAHLAVGRVPVRRLNHSGLYPVPGDGEWDWQGVLRPSDLPARLDPPQGFLVTANHRVTAPDYPFRISLEWGGEPYRAERITELIQARPRHDRGSMEALQQDTVTLLQRELRPVLKAMKPRSLAAQRWRLRLLAWDGDAALDSAESSVFHAWYVALAALPAAETGTDYWGGYPRFLIRALTQGDPACDMRGLSCVEFAAEALEQALARLGDEPGVWGELHHAHLAHALFTHTPLSALSDRVVPTGGSHHTVNVGWFRPQDWVVYHAPTYRQIVDLADPERSLFVLAGGQSGNWFSSNYDDQIALWRDGAYLAMRREGYEVADTLMLHPAPK